jgi:WD40 repeat protein
MNRLRRVATAAAPSIRHALPYVCWFARRRVLTSGPDGVWRVWDLAGTLAFSRRVIRLNGTDVHAEFSPDGHRVLTRSSADGAVVWAVSAGSESRALLQSTLWTGLVCFIFDGRRIAVADTNDVVRVLDAATGKPAGQEFGMRPPARRPACV